MKNFTTRVCLVFMPLVGCFTCANAQQGVTLTTDGYGFGIIGKVNPDIKGSPYLYDDWIKGSVMLMDGTVYKDLDLIFDIIKKQLIFKGDNQTPLMFEKPVKEFTLNFSFEGNEHSRTFRNGFSAFDGATTQTYYEVLSDGNVKLLKKIQKKVAEERSAGSILAVKVINEQIAYYILRNQQLMRVKKDKKSILTALSDKAQIIEPFVNNSKLNFKEEDSLVKVVNYYNRVN